MNSNQELNYTGSLKTIDGQSYTWSVKSFKLWKKRFQRAYFLEFNRSLKEDFPDKTQREVLYKKLLGFKDIDIFGSSRIGINVVIDAIKYQKALEVSKIIYKI